MELKGEAMFVKIKDDLWVNKRYIRSVYFEYSAISETFDVKVAVKGYKFDNVFELQSFKKFDEAKKFMENFIKGIKND